MLVERLLTTEGYRVVTASDGFHAVAIYEKLHGQVQLVILDFKMPGMDGFAVFNKMRDINPQVLAALTSGYVEEIKLKGMLTQGMRGFIPKPLTQQKFLLQVRSIIEAGACSSAACP